MDGNVQRRSSRSSSLAQSPTNEGDDSDAISLTSTIQLEDPPDTEYVVEDVHAEREQEINGQIKPVYLVEWANFPLDQCTWEPLDNLPPALTKQWEDKKATQDPSVALEFEEKYTAAFNAKLEEARQRHRQRNAKRRRLGYDTTPFWFRGQQQSDSEFECGSADEALDSEPEAFTPSSNDDNECEEANQDNTIDHKAMEALELTKSCSEAKLPQPSRPPSRVFTFDPDKAKQSAKAKSKEATPTSNSGKGPQKTHTGKRLNGDREAQLTSGYQGSARKSDTIDSSSSRSAYTSISKAAAVAEGLKSTPSAVKATPDAAMKALTGKKTTRPTMPVNIFTSGKLPRTRQGVGEAEIDGNQKPKMFKQAKYRRKAELRARERDDQAPDISKIADVMFTPGSNAGASHYQPQGQASQEAGEIQGTPSEVSQGLEKQSNTTAPAPAGGASITTDSTRHAGPPKRSSLSSIATDADRPNKKAKKVHFTEVEAGPSVSYGSSSSMFQTRSERFPEADDKWIRSGTTIPNTTEEEGLFVDEPMHIDGISDPSPDHRPVDVPSTSAPGIRRLSLSTYRFRDIQCDQSVGKKIKLSTSAEKILDVTFDALPKTASGGLAQQWLNDFRDTNCIEMGHMVLAETLVAQLPSLSSQGFTPLCSGTVTSATSSEDLEVLAEHLRMSSSGLFVARVHFNLLIFPTRCSDFDGLSNFGVEPTSASGVALKYFMFTSALPIFQQIRPCSSTIHGLETRASEEKVVLFPKILGVQYSALIGSASPKKKKPAHFFLGFPQRAIEWQRSIASWLSTREKTCKIYTNFDPGSWLAFVEKAKRERGVVIVHEALVPFLRRFPRLAKLLLKSSINIWHFSESLDLGPPQPLVGSGIIPAMSTKLSRLFPFGSAILVTPSFVVSEPQAAFRLLKWFYEKKAKEGNYKLVVAYDFLDYLSELSREKSALRSHLQEKLWARKPPLYVAMDKNKAALTDLDLEARQKTCIYMGWWLSEQVHSEAPFSDFNPTIVADRSIDPHDEQGLVNWFGWWSMAHSHEYRKFFVVGSSSTTDGAVVHTLTNRTSRKVPLAKYSTVLNDPDEAMRISLIQQEQREAENSGFQSQYFHDDEDQIGPWLETQDKGYMCKLYPFPVSWADKPMAVHYGDPGLSFKMIEQWWDSIVPWGSGHHRYNTFIGFFHTIPEKWDSDKPPQTIKARRQPWLAIWRPVDPHEKGTLYSHGKTELIIWDVRAGAELEAKPSLQLKDLTWMQQALIKHIQLHAHEKNPNSFLEKVWLGGFQAHQNLVQSKAPADVTAEFLMRLIGSLQHTLAAAAKFMYQSGYRRVTLRMGPFNTHNDAQGDFDPDADTRIIFHAPRGSGGLQPSGVSKCINELFEAAKEERLRFKHAKEMIYTYPPTLTWYQKQVDEGRHFEHIFVDEWDKVFSLLGIVDKSSSAPASASGDRATSASVRRGSGSSNHSSTSYETPVA